MAYTQQDKQMAATALQFMSKVRMDGTDAPAFVAVNNWLQSIIQPAGPEAAFPFPSDAKEHDAN